MPFEPDNKKLAVGRRNPGVFLLCRARERISPPLTSEPERCLFKVAGWEGTLMTISGSLSVAADKQNPIGDETRKKYFLAPLKQRDKAWVVD